MPGWWIASIGDMRAGGGGTFTSVGRAGHRTQLLVRPCVRDHLVDGGLCHLCDRVLITLKTSAALI